MVKRLLRHLAAPPWVVRRLFPAHARRQLEDGIKDSEARHTGEIRIAVEAALPLGDLLKGISARQRAEQVFSDLRVWDTQENNGVLIYVLLTERSVEILADRGIASRVGPEIWREICERMEVQFRTGHYVSALLEGLAAATDVLVSEFPATGQNANELPDRPTFL